MVRIIKTTTILFALLFIGLYFRDKTMMSKVSFEHMTSEEMHQQILSERDHAIKVASEDGYYNCCIEPPCTMCYMEANIWNNYEAGTCACDDLIAQGKEPCPQCKNGLCEISENDTCKVEGIL